MLKKQLAVLLVCGHVGLASVAGADSLRVPNPANGHSYEQFNVNLTWQQAKEACAAEGGYLATITSAEEKTWIADHVQIPSSSPVWLGGTDARIEGTWEWITGEPFIYTNWYPGEPNDARGEDHLSFYSSDNGHRWNDWADYNKTSYLCEWNSLPPVISSITATPQAGVPPLDVVFKVFVKDQDGAIGDYNWDFNGDGVIDATTSVPTTNYTYQDLGKYTAQVTVVDDSGAKAKSAPLAIQCADGPELSGEVAGYIFDNATNTIHLDFKVSNVGNAVAGQFTVRFALRDLEVSSPAEIFNRSKISGLAVGDSTVVSVDHTFDSAIAGKVIRVIIDDYRKVAEVDEKNNGIEIAIRPIPRLFGP